MNWLTKKMGSRRAGIFAAGIVGGAVCLAGTAFACTPVVGAMAVRAMDGSSAGSTSVTVAAGPGGNMEFCQTINGAGFSNGISGGAAAAPGDTIAIAVAPTSCPRTADVENAVDGVMDIVNAAGDGPEAMMAAVDRRKFLGVTQNLLVNSLLTDSEADITFSDEVFSRTSSAYTYNIATNGDCMDLSDDPASPKMAVVNGVGAKQMAVPNTLAPSGASDSAGVCVNARNPIDTTAWVISMAPLVVL